MNLKVGDIAIITDTNIDRGVKGKIGRVIDIATDSGPYPYYIQVMYRRIWCEARPLTGLHKFLEGVGDV